MRTVKVVKLVPAIEVQGEEEGHCWCLFQWEDHSTVLAWTSWSFHKHLRHLLFACWTKPHESTGESLLIFVLYGRDARIPCETTLTTTHTAYEVDIDDYKSVLVFVLSEAWELARKEIERFKRSKSTSNLMYSNDNSFFGVMSINLIRWKTALKVSIYKGNQSSAPYNHTSPYSLSSTYSASVIPLSPYVGPHLAPYHGAANGTVKQCLSGGSEWCYGIHSSTQTIL